jgi:phosphatidylethanolamine-binding protein (PEBP) family uncharacterized protein
MKTDAFEDGGVIPERYAGRGGNVRPAFTFSNIPAGTVTFAIGSPGPGCRGQWSR